MTVINPCDYNQTKAATIAIAEHEGPVYLRFGRPKVPIFIEENEPFVIGKAVMLNEGTDVSIFATGHLVLESDRSRSCSRGTGNFRRNYKYPYH